MFWEALRIWNDFKIFGLPHGKGPAFEKPMTLNVIRLFENWSHQISNWEREDLGK